MKTAYANDPESGLIVRVSETSNGLRATIIDTVRNQIESGLSITDAYGHSRTTVYYLTREAVCRLNEKTGRITPPIPDSSTIVVSNDETEDSKIPVGVVESVGEVAGEDIPEDTDE